MSVPRNLVGSLGRGCLLLILVAIGTVLLTRLAPGYFSDARELDARSGERVRAQLRSEEALNSSAAAVLAGQIGAWARGDLGVSRQYELPVSQLVRERAANTLILMAQGIALGWSIAIVASLALSRTRFGSVLGIPFLVVLVCPATALVTVCVATNHGGAALVLAAIVAARDYHFLRRAFVDEWTQPHLLMCQAMGLRGRQVLLHHVLPRMASQLASLATISFLTALSALVPVEVLFDRPGLGQLAWSAAMNRDIPVLLTITLMAAACVCIAGALSDRASGEAAVPA